MPLHEHFQLIRQDHREIEAPGPLAGREPLTSLGGCTAPTWRSSPRVCGAGAAWPRFYWARGRGTFLVVDSLPQGLIVGLVLPQAPPGVELPDLPEITFELLSALFSELALSQGYRNFQSEPNGSFLIYGPNVNDKLVVQAGLVQVSDPVAEGAQRAADRAGQVIKSVVGHLGIIHVLQLGVKWVFHVPCPDGARKFALERLARTTEEQLDDLAMGAPVWPGVHYMSVSDAQGTQWSVRIEPLLADDAFLFVEVDTGFSNVQVPGIRETIGRVLEYAQGPVMAHIDNLKG